MDSMVPEHGPTSKSVVIAFLETNIGTIYVLMHSLITLFADAHLSLEEFGLLYLFSRQRMIYPV